MKLIKCDRLNPTVTLTRARVPAKTIKGLVKCEGVACMVRATLDPMLSLYERTLSNMYVELP